MEETATKTKLSGHIKTAVNAIEKEIFRLNVKVKKLEDKAIAAYQEVEELKKEIEGLKEQQAKLHKE